MERIAELIERALKGIGDPAAAVAVREGVAALCGAFPLPYGGIRG
mgnify:CR=1 FL=1